MRLDADFLVQKYTENIFRAAYSVTNDRQDAEDAVQETFLQHLRFSGEFESEEHIKAWLLRCAINRSKNTVISFWKRKKISFEEYMTEDMTYDEKDHELIGAVMSLPEKIRIVIHLYYYEDYRVSEIGKILKVSESAVKNRLLRGRRMLKEILKEDWEDE